MSSHLRLSGLAALLAVLPSTGAQAQVDSGAEGAAADRQAGASGNSGLAAPGSAQIDRLLQGATAEAVALAAGKWDVTPSGAFQYNLPIEVPVGRRGVAPRLALTYDSQLGNGLLGVGWSVTGLPAIVRIPHTQGVRFDGGDHFAVAPQGYGTPSSPSTRLLPIGGGLYHTARETWAEYQGIGTCGNGPCSWRMRDGKGGTYVFGAAASAQLWERDSGRGQTNRGVLAWGVTHYVDPYGNAFQIGYRKDFAMLYPQSIEWNCGPYTLPSDPPWTPTPVPSPGPDTPVVPGDPPTVPGFGTPPPPSFPGQPVVGTSNALYTPLLPALAPTVTSGSASVTITVNAASSLPSATALVPIVPLVPVIPVAVPACASRRGISFGYTSRTDVTPLPERYADVLTSITITSAGAPVRSYDLSYTPSSITGRSLLTRIERRGSDGLAATALPPLTFNYGLTATRPASTALRVEGRDGPLSKATPEAAVQALAADFDGDGFDDVVRVAQWSARRWVELARGSASGLGTPTVVLDSAGDYEGWKALAADVTADGRADLILWHADYYGGRIEIAAGTTGGLNPPFSQFPNAVNDLVHGVNWGPDTWRLLAGDVTGDQVADLVLVNLMSRDVVTIPGDGLGTLTVRSSRFGLAEFSRRMEPLLEDMNGDGRADLVLTYSRDNALYAIFFAGAPGGLAAGQLTWLAPTAARGYAPYQVLGGDLNGDGFGDLTIAYTGNTVSLAQVGPRALRPFGRDVRTYYGAPLPGAPNALGMLFAAPRDQITDTASFNSYTVSNRRMAAWQHHSADLNGDGLSDLVMVYAGQHGLHVHRALADAQGGLGPTTTLNLTASLPTAGAPDGDLNVAKWQSQIADIDGDGLDDVVLFYSGPSGAFVRAVRGSRAGLTGTLETLLSSTDTEAQAPAADDGRRADSVVLLTPDVNGDGKPDLVLSDFSRLQLGLTAPGASDVLTSTGNGFGGVATVTSTAAARVPCAIRPAASCAASTSSPGVPNRSARPLTTQVTDADGRGGSRTDSFSYSNGRFYPGFLEPPPASSRTFRADLGFEWMEARDAATGLATRTTYRLDAPYERNPSQVEVIAPTAAGASTTAIYRRETFAYGVAPARYAGVADVRLTDHTTTTWEAGVQASAVTEHFEHDSYGARTLARRCADGRCLDQVTVFDHDAARWVLGRVRNVLVRPQNVNLVLSWDRYTYQANDLPTRQESLLCASAASCPCTASETACAAAVARWVPVAHSLTYDTSGQLLTRSDALGHVTTTTYDPVFGAYPATVSRTVGTGAAARVLTRRTTYDSAGRVDTETDPTGAVVDHDLDVHGRPIRLTRPGGAYETWSYQNSGNPAIQFIRHEVVTALDGAGAPVLRWDQRYFDGHGKVHTAYERHGSGNYTVKRREELYQGGQRLARLSMPWLVTQGAAGPVGLHWLEVAFDPLGRVASATRKRQDAPGVLSVLGVLTRQSRSGSQVIIEDNGSLVDATGVLTESNRWRTTRRNFDSLARLTSIVDAAGNTTSYGYDDLGRLVRLAGPYTAAEAAAPPQVTTLGYDGFGRARTRTDSVSGQTSMDYDDVGNLTASTDALGRRVTWSFDELDRPRVRMAPNALGVAIPVAQWGYDDPAVPFSLGRLTSVTYPEGSQRITAYDGRGNRLGRSTTISGLVGTQTESFTYDLADRQLTRRFPDGAVQQNRYDLGGELDRVSVDNVAWATWEAFDAGGRPGRRTLHLPGMTTTYGYDGDGLMTSLETRQTTPVVSWVATQWQSYGFDARGNVRSLTDGRGALAFSLTQVDSNDSWTYGYDALDRLTSATTASGYVMPFGYDARGNITQTGPGLAQTYRPGEIIAQTFTARPANCLPGSLCPLLYFYLPNFTATFDVAGQLVSKLRASGERWDYGYDGEGRLSTVRRGGSTVAQYSYDHVGQRIKKVAYLTGGQTMTTFYVGDAYEVREHSSARGVYAVTRSVRAGDRGVVGTTTSGQLAGQPLAASWTDARRTQAMTGDTLTGVPTGTVFHLGNHLGTTAVVVDSAGTEVSRSIHAPYGALIRERSSGHDGVTRRFTGHELDEESGLVYMNARHYDPELARFLTPDTVIPGGGLEPQGLNRYAYVLGNPLRYTDPSGHVPNELHPVTNDLLTDFDGNEIVLPSGKTVRQQVNEDLAKANQPLPWHKRAWNSLKERVSGKVGVSYDAGGGVKGKLDSKGKVNQTTREFAAGPFELSNSSGVKDGHLYIEIEAGLKKKVNDYVSAGFSYVCTITATGPNEVTVEHAVKGKASIGPGKQSRLKELSIDPEVKFVLSTEKIKLDVPVNEVEGYVPFVRPPDPLRGQVPDWDGRGGR